MIGVGVALALAFVDAVPVGEAKRVELITVGTRTVCVPDRDVTEVVKDVTVKLVAVGDDDDEPEVAVAVGEDWQTTGVDST